MKRTFTLLTAILCANFIFAQNWTNLNCPAPGGQLGDIDHTNNTIYATRLTGGFFKSTDAGATWTDVTTNYPAGQTQNFVCLNSGNILLYMFTGSTFPWYKSTDQGSTWTLISGSTPIGGCSVFESSNGTLYWVPSYDGFTTIKTSTDEGATWTPQSAVLKHMAFTSNGDAYGLRYDSGSGTVKLSKSTDNGQTWTDLTATGLPATCEQIAISPNGNIYVQNGSPVHKSTDNGSTFVSIDSASTAIYTDHNNNLFSGKGSKFMVTADGGTTWQNATSGLAYPSGTVGRIWAHPNGSTYASNYNPSTATWGIYEYSSGGSSVSETAIIPEISVSPNPFTTQAVLKISNMNAADLSGTALKFYDILGAEVQVSFVRGSDAFTITRGDLQPGIYFCELLKGNTPVSRTKVVVR